MYETSLVECTGSYEALSYVWGNASEKTPIQINGQTLEIGPNLRLALFNLRELDKPRTLWIDAICIRQACTNERNQQVAIMGEIYRQARRTVVWLGDEVKVETKAAISMLEALAEDAISRFRGSHGDGNGEVENIVHLNNLPVSMIEKAGVKDPMFDRYGRRLGRAANGYLCLVPAAAEVGDKVILARGGRVPLVVREDGGTGYWQLVGEAYVHGIMDGEAWEDKCKEFHVR